MMPGALGPDDWVARLPSRDPVHHWEDYLPAPRAEEAEEEEEEEEEPAAEEERAGPSGV